MNATPPLPLILLNDFYENLCIKLQGNVLILSEEDWNVCVLSDRIYPFFVDF